MPNWCMNNLTVEHADPSMVDRFEQAYNAGKACNEFIPVPEDIGDGWWDFCVNNWGTKWDIGADIGTDKAEYYGLKATRVGNQVSCTFDSAWAPPVGLYRELDRLGYRVNATYLEPSMCFCGEFKDGEDNCVEYRSKEMIPRRIWDEYDCRELFEDGTATTE